MYRRKKPRWVIEKSVSVKSRGGKLKEPSLICEGISEGLSQNEIEK
ncbi:hypothetical protein [Candidatus Protochlamydia amoebophila]|nr:hypothetical protein [Candidatus Protochlamydia amoebophila]